MAEISQKRQAILKSFGTMSSIAAIAAFVTVFSLVSAHSLLNKLTFQNHVINARTTARNQLQSDITAATKLNSAYEDFNQAGVNLLGSSAAGVDNDNAKIVLDALPSSYDYPALTTSLQNLLSNQGVTVDSIGGSDQSATVSGVGTGTATSPSPSTSSSVSGPVAMPFTFSIDGPYQNVQNVIAAFEKSIRPFQFQTLDFSGNQSDVTLTVTAQTFFQPATSFNITQEKVQ